MSFDRSKLPIVHFHSVGLFPSNDFVLGPYLNELTFSRGTEKKEVKEFGLEKDDIRISGHNQNQDELNATVYLDGRIVSRNHARVSWQLKKGNDKPKLYLKDLSSTHGTFIHRADADASFQAASEYDEEIRDGDCITIGRKIEKGDECHLPAIFDVSFEYHDEAEMINISSPIMEARKKPDSDDLAILFRDEMSPFPMGESKSEGIQKALKSSQVIESDDSDSSDVEDDDLDPEDVKIAIKSIQSMNSDRITLSLDEDEPEKYDVLVLSESSEDEDAESMHSESEEAELGSGSEDESTDMTDSSTHVPSSQNPIASKNVSIQEKQVTETHIVVQDKRLDSILEKTTKETVVDTVVNAGEDEEEAKSDGVSAEEESSDEKEKSIEPEETKQKDSKSTDGPLKSTMEEENIASDTSKVINAKRNADEAELDDHESTSSQTNKSSRDSLASSSRKGSHWINRSPRKVIKPIAQSSSSHTDQARPEPKRQKIGFGAGLAAGVVFGIVGTFVGLLKMPASDLA